MHVVVDRHEVGFVDITGRVWDSNWLISWEFLHTTGNVCKDLKSFFMGKFLGIFFDKFFDAVSIQ